MTLPRRVDKMGMSGVRSTCFNLTAVEGRKMTSPPNSAYLSSLPSDKVEWRPIAGFENLYLISEFGDVLNIRRGKLKKLQSDKNGYPAVVLYLGEGGRYRYRNVHLYVAEAFLGPRPAGLQVNHKDGVKYHNHYSNLEYQTPKGNTQHAWATGLAKRRFGAQCHAAKLTIQQVESIRQRIAVDSGEALAREFKVSSSTIWRISTGQSWTAK